MAFGNDTFSAAGGAANDLFAAEGFKYKAKGNRLEMQNYNQAALLADQNAQFTQMSTAIKETQQQRDIDKALGGTRADVAGAGFAASGSALDILRDSAAQGALTKAVISQQGLITEAGYHQQAASYRTMADAANMAAHADEQAATGAYVSAGIKGITALATLV